jgi:uncharacterized protein (DUF4213/DUF364 family)
MMKFAQHYYRLASRVADAIDIPPVTAIHLPTPVDDKEKPDEFGFVFLADGSVGPFYTSLEDSLDKLWQLVPDGRTLQCDTMDLISKFKSSSMVQRSLALGAFNAMSQHVMARAGYSPVEASSAKSSPQADQKIALVGYIRPMIEKLLDKGCELLVLEKNPARVEIQPGLVLSTDPADLKSRDYIICTASTLINDTLGEILQHRRNAAHISLVGPSGSGLPDIVFEQGIDDIGGILFDDLDALQQALEQQQPWGHAGHKYQITPADYPGVERLLANIHNCRS